MACADEFVARLPDGLNSRGRAGQPLKARAPAAYYGAGLLKKCADFIIG